MNINPNPELNSQVRLLYEGFKTKGIKAVQLPRNTITLDEIWDELMETTWWKNLNHELMAFTVEELNHQIEKLGYRPFSTSYHRKMLFDWKFTKGWFISLTFVPFAKEKQVLKQFFSQQTV